MQTGADDPVPALVCSVPAGHAPWARHTDWFAAVVYVPAAHVPHWRSVTLEPALLTYEPTSHVLQGVQAGAFTVVESLPLAHAVHVRSLVELPSLVTCWPGAQLLRGTHMVAGSPSLSQVPSGQTCFAVVPPAQ